ncbi:cytochrome P450 [Micropruina sp.]|uniref:cytochrome P450 n=1 Tax=Micropruina sp. TaxID=2737536 RepID=UPI0039E53428
MSFAVPGRAGLTAAWNERRLLWAAHPGLGALMTAAQLAPAMAKLPRIGWVVRDPRLIRKILLDHSSTTLLGEGGVGHLWAQLLGDWVHDSFDGPGHLRLRTRAKDLFSQARAEATVAAAAGDLLAGVTERLRAGEAVDAADVGRIMVGRLISQLLGLDVTPFRDRAAASGLDFDGNGAYRAILAQAEELTKVAVGTTGDTRLSPSAIAHARRIIAELTADVPQNYRNAGPATLLGRCRELGLSETEATGLATLMLVAGTGTASSAIGRTTALLADSGQVRRLAAATGADRAELLEIAIREGLRVTSPAPMIGRHVRADFDVDGRRLRAGDRVVALVYAANSGAGGFSLDRGYLPETRQLWFGAGRHLCLGSSLAKAELRLVLGSFLDAGPWRVVERTRARGVLIPAYRRLLITAA